MYVNCIRGHRRVCYKIGLIQPNDISLLQSEFSSVEYVGMAWEQEIFRISGPDLPPTLCYHLEDHFVAVNEKGHEALIKPPLASILKWSTFYSSDKDGCECILYEPANPVDQLPLLVLLHGGPHNSFPALYTPDILFYIKNGFAVLVPNYHGSFGYGDAFLHSLNGHIGEIDVKDVQSAVSETLKRQPLIDPQSVILMGSSYGGFLGLRLLEENPSLFQYAVIRNGVLDTVTMMTSSDMAYWMMILAGVIPSRGTHTEKVKQIIKGTYVYTFEDLRAVQAFNPLQSIAKVQTPITFILGGKDCRVVNQQTFEAYRILKGLERCVEILMIPNEDHVLRGYEARALTATVICEWKKKKRQLQDSNLRGQCPADF